MAQFVLKLGHAVVVEHMERNSTNVILASACTLLILSFGYRAGFGLFVKPISDINGWGRDVISLSLALQNLVWGVVAVVAGGLADRFGNSKVIIAGTLFYGSGIWLMAGVDSPWLLHSSAGLLVGAGVAGTSFGIVLPAMARAVAPERRQWALGLGTAAGSVGQILLVPISQGLLEAYGWITALQILGVSSLLMAVFAMPLAPHSGKADVGEAPPERSILDALREALSHQSYGLLLLGFFVCGFHVAFITAHMPAFLIDAGYDARLGAWSIAIIGLCNVIGAYSSGLLSSRFNRKYILAVIYFGRTIVITWFLLCPMSVTSVVVFSALMGFLWLATVPPTAGLVGLMFGTRYMALLYGVVFFSHQVGSFTGIWLGGWLYDYYGSYGLIWWAGVVLGLVAGVLHLPIKEEPLSRLANASAQSPRGRVG